jgi:T-complex protein 1 subunit gamma
MKQNISVIRRARKTDNNRISRVTGATIVNRPDELEEKDIGTKCGLFEVRKIGDDYFTFFEECDSPEACSILLRGATKDSLNEIERNLADAMAVGRNVLLDPKVVTGGGSVEMHLAQ